LFTSAGSIACFPDNEPNYRHRPAAQDHAAKGESGTEYTRKEHYKMIDFLRGTDVLIMDAQYDREEYKYHQGWGHACVDDVVKLALEARVRQLFLFHHDPEHDDGKISQMVAHAQKLAAAQNGWLLVEAARGGAMVEVAKSPNGR